MDVGLLIPVVILSLVILYGVVELRKGLSEISRNLQELKGALAERDTDSG